MQSKTHYGEFTLRYWIKQICAGNIILPPYQRYFVWNTEQVESLAQSLSKDLFVPPVTIGHIDGKNIIIDGQQRLTSILLCYFSAMPKKEAFLKRVSDIDQINNEDDDDEEADIVNDTGILSYYDWSLNTLIDAPKDFEELRRTFSDSTKYDKLKLDWFNDNFLDNHYMGFAYIVPKDKANKKANHKFFSTVFRQVNMLGNPLLKPESRKSLYFLDDEFQPLFDPEFLRDYVVSPAGSDPQPLDFVRILSFLFEYSKRESSTRVLRAMKAKTEEYYEQFIDHIIHHAEYEKPLKEGEEECKADSSRFSKYSKIFSDKQNLLLSGFKDNVALVRIPKLFKSIIDADLYFLGLTYWGLFKNKKITVDNEDERARLIESLNNSINEYKKDKSHSKSPGSLKHIRSRIDSSIEIYKPYFNKPEPKEEEKDAE